MDFGFQVLVSGFFFSGTSIADFKRGEIALWYCLGESIALFTLLLLLTFSTLRAGAKCWLRGGIGGQIPRNV